MKNKIYPTINQLVRKGRQTTTAKSTAPALQKRMQTQKKIELQIADHHKKEVFCTVI